MLLELLFFLLMTLLIFTLPGITLLNFSKVKVPLLEKIALGTSLGLCLFTLLGFLSFVIKIPAASLLILLLTLTFLKLSYPFKFKLEVSWTNLLLTVILILAVLGQLLIISPSGLNFGPGIYFFSAHGHDGPWHIALMEEFSKDYPFQNPSLAGERLLNYHFFSDIAPAVFLNLFHFSSFDLYFRFFPLLYSILLATLSFSLGKFLGKSYLAGIWTLFFFLFSGSFGYIATFLKDRSFGGESIFWATQIQSSIGNPPQILSVILILTFIYLLVLYLSSPKKILAALLILIAGILPMFKVYGGVVLFFSLAVISIWQIVKDKKFHLLLILIISGALALLIYLPHTKASANFLIFEPFWFIHTMMVSPDRLNSLDWELRRQTYISEHNLKRVLSLEGFGLLLFFFGNLGTKSLGITYLIKNFKNLSESYCAQFLISMAIFSFIMPLLFLQRGVATNTSQFLEYFLLTFALFAGITTAKIISLVKQRVLLITLTIIIVIFSIPTQASLIYSFYQGSGNAQISNLEISALNFLRNNSKDNDTVLTPPKGKVTQNNNPQSIWNWFDTSYVAALSGRRVYFADKEQIDILGYDYTAREKLQKDLFSTTDLKLLSKLLQDSQVNYLYFPKAQAPVINLKLTTLQKIYENNEVEIWKINP